MNDPAIPLKEWLTCFRDIAREVSATALRFDSDTPVGPPAADGPRPGVYVAILSDAHALHLGLQTTPAGCHRLACALLGMRYQQPLSEREVMDGVSEVINILAGRVKSKMAGRDGALRLGLPMFMKVPIEPPPGTERVSTDVQIGPVAVELLVYRRRREQQAA